MAISGQEQQPRVDDPVVQTLLVQTEDLSQDSTTPSTSLDQICFKTNS